jgi:hypothetical protein
VSIRVYLPYRGIPAHEEGYILESHRRTTFYRVPVHAVTHKVQLCDLEVGGTVLIEQEELGVSVDVLVLLSVADH